MSRFLSERLAGLSVYTPGEQPKNRKYIKLNTNESPYPPSPAVLEVLNRGEAEALRLYPDPECGALKAAIAKEYGVGTENVFVSNGSDESLSFAFMAFCDERHGIVFPDITYGFYPVYAKLYGVPYEEIPLRADLTLAPADYMSVGRNVVIANPNAPTGLAIPEDEIEKIVRSNPDHVVMIDEAYVDFHGEGCISLTRKYSNLLVIRTFSKSRQLAGARLGYAIGDAALIEDLERIKFSTNPYNINRLSMAAGIAAMEDRDYFKTCRDEIVRTRKYTVRELRRLGFDVTDSRANFVFAKHPCMSGEEIYTKLREAGILVRHFSLPRIADYNRITVGTPAEMEEMIRVLEGILTP